MMDSEESERMSVLLSTYLERRLTGTEEILNIRRKAIVLQERLINSDVVDFIYTGSFGEGCYQEGSDLDRMMVDKKTIVLCPDERIPQHLTHKTIMYIREADCRPGYVHLEICQLKRPLDKHLYKSIIRIGNSMFLSSDIYREELNTFLATQSDMKCESSGPSSSLRGILDTVHCFPCKSWPKEANGWIKRTRLYGWPHQKLIDKIVKSGCHLVPVGDKCSKDTFLQWRISFAVAERSLVHSFTHIQVKVYVLLKYFLKQIKETLKEIIGDDDILCSYFLKTILFHALENSSQIFWQEKNLFYCFWFCLNILFAWVQAGFCPNYFIPVNNLFQRKVHGQHQRILLEILDNYSQMKWMCLSVGNFYKPSIWEDLCDTFIKAELVRQKTVQEDIMDQDDSFRATLSARFLYERGCINNALYSLSTSKSDFEESFTYFNAVNLLRCLASELIQKDNCENVAAPDNKTRYRRMRKCKYWMTPSALFGTEVLYLATFHFLTGNFSKCLEMSRQVVRLASYYREELQLHPELRRSNRNLYLPHCCGLERLQKMYIMPIIFLHENMHIPYLSLELPKKHRPLPIPPLPYVLFLNFLCHHEDGDTKRRDEALHHLIQVQCHKKQGGQTFWIVHTLLRICYQILGDYHRAIQAYWESAQSQGIVRERNPALDRIAVVYLCMYVSQRSDRGYL